MKRLEANKFIFMPPHDIMVIEAKKRQSICILLVVVGATIPMFLP
jgi:hypothetical protein